MSRLQAGAAETDITPMLGTLLAGLFHDRPAEDIHDPLKSKAVVLDNGTTQLAIAALDLIGLNRLEVEGVRQRVAEATRIPGPNVMIACTHTHTGPEVWQGHSSPINEAYREWIVPRIADSIRLAQRRLRTARLAWGQGEQHDISFCRRYRMRDGTVRMNPGSNNPDIVEPASPIDPHVGVLYIEDEDRRPIAVISRFSLHYVGTDNNNAVSADYYAHFATVMQRLLDTDCPVLLLNGTSGQINASDPFDPEPDRGHRKARRVATALAGEVAKVIGRLRPDDQVSLAVTSRRIELQRQAATDQDVEIARRIVAGDDPSPGSGPFSWVVGQPLPERVRRAYARSQIKLAQMPRPVTTEVQAMRIGDSAWVALPGEIFVEIGFTIHNNSPAAGTFVVSLANDSLGYFPTDHAFKEEGGYETWPAIWSPIGPSERILTSAASDCLHRLFP